MKLLLRAVPQTKFVSLKSPETTPLNKTVPAEDFKQNTRLFRFPESSNRLSLINSQNPLNYPFLWSIMQTQFSQPSGRSSQPRSSKYIITPFLIDVYYWEGVLMKDLNVLDDDSPAPSCSFWFYSFFIYLFLLFSQRSIRTSCPLHRGVFPHWRVLKRHSLSLLIN